MLNVTLNVREERPRNAKLPRAPFYEPFQKPLQTEASIKLSAEWKKFTKRLFRYCNCRALIGLCFLRIFAARRRRENAGLIFNRFPFNEFRFNCVAVLLERALKSQI